MLVNKSEGEGTVAVTSVDLQRELKSSGGLYSLVQDGRMFVMVVTKQFPRGEIGVGELMPVDRFHDISDSIGTEYW